MRSSGMDITLDDLLTILDKHYNNIKALDTLNQELFQLQMQERKPYQTGCLVIQTPPNFGCLAFPECFPPDCIAKKEELKSNCFYGGLPLEEEKQLKAMVCPT